jgi:hypothetical protein
MRIGEVGEGEGEGWEGEGDGITVSRSPVWTVESPCAE